MAVRTRVQSQMHGDSSDYDYSSFYYSSSDDVFAILDPTGRGRQRWSNRWKAALSASEITFDGRLSAGTS